MDEGDSLPPPSYPWVDVYLLMRNNVDIVPSSIEKEVVTNLIIEGNIHNIT